MINVKDFNKISDYLWEVPKDFRHDMRVPARVYATREMLEDVLDEKSIDQLINTATLPGVVKYVLAMPDIHQGYGFPIGGVAAMEASDGVISPGGVGYDINCGVRFLISEYNHEELKEQIPTLISQIQRDVPSGVGRGGRLDLSTQELNEVLDKGANWALQQGYASKEDLESIEENGCYKVADSTCVSDKAKQRGRDQLGTLGAGNHFLELQEVVEIFDKDIANAFGISLGQVTLMIHTGSRGFGHQVCTDYVSLMNKNMPKYRITLPDRQLACAPFDSDEGQNYFKSMAAAANFAWVNRQIMTDIVRRSWIQVLGGGKHQLKLVYDVAHNIAKLETYDGKKLIVHRKGATRAFGPNHPDLPEKYKITGQPVIIPGSMGTYSYVLSGTNDAMENTFGSTCHGAGRCMSRTKAKKVVNYQTLRKQLEQYGVEIRAGSHKGLVEEAPEAYKDIDDVIEVVHKAKIAKKIAKMKPIAVVKG